MTQYCHCIGHDHWRIQGRGGGRDARAAGRISFILMQFSAEILPNNRFLPQTQGLAPPPPPSGKWEILDLPLMIYVSCRVPPGLIEFNAIDIQPAISKRIGYLTTKTGRSSSNTSSLHNQPRLIQVAVKGSASVAMF